MTKKRYLIFGLPGSGKTSYADDLANEYQRLGYSVTRFNADQVRTEYNDWDFSVEGRVRQAYRMYNLSMTADTDIVITDFVAPTEEIRSLFYSDFTLVYIDTIKESRFQDTNKIFEKPMRYDHTVTEFWNRSDLNSSKELFGDKIENL